jgi:hypothetical protein
MLAVASHPFASVPTTVYALVVVGETVILLVVAPVLQAYEAAPVAVKVELDPKQMNSGAATASTVGSALTVTVTNWSTVQPLAVPETV